MQIRFQLDGADLAAPIRRSESINGRGTLTLHELLQTCDAGWSGQEMCADGGCSRCTVLLNGLAVNACQVLAQEVAGQHVQTLRSFESHPLVQQVRAAQGPCGQCLSAYVLATLPALEAVPAPALNDLRRRLQGISCECQLGHHVLAAARQWLTHSREGSV